MDYKKEGIGRRIVGQIALYEFRIGKNREWKFGMVLEKDTDRDEDSMLIDPDMKSFYGKSDKETKHVDIGDETYSNIGSSVISSKEVSVKGKLYKIYFDKGEVMCTQQVHARIFEDII